MQARGIIQVLLYLIGYGLLIPGVVATGVAFYIPLPYWMGELCSMALIGFSALPVIVPMIVVGALVIWAARRYGASGDCR